MNQNQLNNAPAPRSVDQQQACSPAANSCFNCANEKTCGYSWLAFCGSRNHTSYEPCILGMMSHGEPFFKPKASLANAMKHDDTEKEVARMIAAGAERLTPRQLTERLDLAGYQVHKPFCFNYTNKANEITYKARAMGYTHKASGMRYAHVDAPRDTLHKLQEIRHNCFVFERGRLWEL